MPLLTLFKDKVKKKIVSQLVYLLFMSRTRMFLSLSSLFFLNKDEGVKYVF